MLGQKGLSTLQLWYVYAVYVTLPKQSINQLIHSMYIYQGFHQVWYQGIVKAKYLDTQMSKEILNYLTYIYYDSQILVHFSSGTYSQFLPVHHSDSDWGYYRGNSEMTKFQIFQIFWAQMIGKVSDFDTSMPKDTWFHLNFNFLKVEVGCYS